jgi:hypothetical protein
VTALMGIARIDGPPPVPPVYGLLQAAAAPAAGVRIVPLAAGEGVERWLNGTEVYPTEKSFGEELPNPQFGAITAYLPETCTAYRIPSQEEFKARAAVALAAVEGSIVAREFLTGNRVSVNPHLSDGSGVFPNGDTVTSPLNALALLDKEIALTGRLGLIHMSPQMLDVLANYRVIDTKTGVNRTPAGNVVIPDFGYADGADPTGHAAATGSQEWMYATGPIDIRRSEMFTTPDRVEQAVDRGTGATTGRTNSITYRAERYYLIDWDTVLQAAVLADRCRTTC